MFCRIRADLSKVHAQGFAGWGGKLRVSLAVLQLHPELREEWGQNGSLCSASTKVVL